MEPYLILFLSAFAAATLLPASSELVLTAIGKGARYGLVMGLVRGIEGWR